MKRLFKYLILPVMMLFICLTNVDAYDQICTYEYTTSAGTLKYRVIITSLDDNLLTSKTARDSYNKWKSQIYVEFYNYNDKKYKTDATGCIVKNRNAYQTGDAKICVLTKDEKTAKKTFFEKGLDGNGGFSCPSLYALKDTKEGLVSLMADKSSADTSKGSSETTGEIDFSDVDIEISDEDMTCAEILGTNLTNIVHLCITILRIAGAIITLLQATMTLIPAISSGDAGALSKAFKKCVMLAIILIVIGVFPTILNLIGQIGGFDLSCLA